MRNILFKLTNPIIRAKAVQFEVEHNCKPTKGADLTDFGWAWGSVDPIEAPDGKVVELGEPVLEGAFVSQPQVLRDKTPEESRNIIADNVTSSPKLGFGGPTLKELVNVN